MANTNTAIEWTEATWGPTTGCDRVSAGCDHCYALTLAKRLKAMGNPRYQNDGSPVTSGPGFGLTLHPDALTIPLHWKKPRRIFVDSMSDLFHAHVPDYFIADVFAVMALAHWHTFQVLTKRPQRMHRLLGNQPWLGAVATRMQEIAAERGIPNPGNLPYPIPNVWLGVSVESQEVAWRIDWLVKTPAAVRFLSCEPLIGFLDLSRWLIPDCPACEGTGSVPVEGGGSACEMCFNRTGAGPSSLGWVIVGGESGPNHRPIEHWWVRDIQQDCELAGVPFFFKQWGGRTPKAGGRLLDGREWSEFPDLAA